MSGKCIRKSSKSKRKIIRCIGCKYLQKIVVNGIKEWRCTF